MSKPRVVVAGAGAIGCYVGGWLAKAGHNVTLLGRKWLADQITAHGLRLTDYAGREARVEVAYKTSASTLKGADIVLVAVKSGATADVAKSIAKYAPKALVVSLQNGVSNPDTLRAILPDADIRSAVVPFNVAAVNPGAFHRGTSGDIMIKAGNGNLAALGSEALRIKEVPDITAQQWGKLLVNLNNPLNALSGVPLLEQLHNRGWRRILADQMTETLCVLKAAGIKPASFTPLPPALVPHLLRLPTPIFRRVAKAMLTIDAQARSSMQDDLRAGRKTEIDALQGEVLHLAHMYNIGCPVIKNVVQALRQAEEAGNGPPMLQPSDIDAI